MITTRFLIFWSSLTIIAAIVFWMVAPAHPHSRVGNRRPMQSLAVTIPLPRPSPVYAGTYRPRRQISVWESEHLVREFDAIFGSVTAFDTAEGKAR